MSLDTARKKRLRALAHSLKPVVIVGQHGVTGPVLEEIEIALAHHQLLKVKLRAERDARAQWLEQILAQTGADNVQTIGQVAVLYRRNPDRPEII
ncbi:MAG: YhbY family RNA-binding protein [Gammaproteobacteria bacterium]